MKHFYIFLIFVIILLLFFAADIIIGSVSIPFNEICKSLFTEYRLKPEWTIILIDFRLPKALTAVMAGMALSISGLEMQTFFRNPLAGPYVLGISSGASLGVAILVMGISLFSGIKIVSGVNQWSLTVAAWIGSGLVLLLILAVSLRIRDNTTILILGILFGSITLALVSILQYFSTESEVKAFVIWTLGSLGNITSQQLKVMLISIGAGLFLSLLSIKKLNALLLGEQYARTLGVNISLSRLLIFLSTSVLTGTITAFCGPIGFIGIAVPHITRAVFSSSDHRILLPGTLLLGSVILLMSDIISQLPGYQQVLPINSVTAIIGIPVIIWIILKKQRLATVT